MAVIEVDSVTKRFPDGTVAVDSADFTIADGEFFILVGPSGCGKSTLLNMIVGLEDISEGTLKIGDRVVNDLDPKDRNLAMVFQNYALYPHLTVRENMAFPLRLRKAPEEEVTRRVEEAARILELTELLERKPAAMSGGQRQRVAMGRAIVREPDAFLFDEPLSNLDAKLRVQMRTEIARLQNRFGTTTVYVTHDQVEAMTLADRVAVMRKGVVQQVASPKDLYNDPVNLFVAGFIGSPAMNMLPGDLEGTTLRLAMVEVTLPHRGRAEAGGGRHPARALPGRRTGGRGRPPGRHLQDQGGRGRVARVRALRPLPGRSGHRRGGAGRRQRPPHGRRARCQRGRGGPHRPCQQPAQGRGG
jgi:multiple sugar transport system ATP-binding protein